MNIMLHPAIDPVALRLGPIQIYWYGIMYLLGFIGAFWLCNHRRTAVPQPWETQEILDLAFYVAVGVIFGGSVGYWLFYHPDFLIEDPLQVLRFWERGRSFHGGLLGVVIALWLFGRWRQRRLLEIGDFILPAVPIGLATGRLGNFINGELWGRATTVPWGMVFKDAGALTRHPSQLYEIGLEGILLFIILQWYIRKPRPAGATSALFLVCYGVFRFFVEFFREPDSHTGFIGFGLTMGQVLSIPMILAGLSIFLYAMRHVVRGSECSNI
jgi:phosphatidylglycerol:prolipoprotein diacylglycerol transferase